jgi:hypothetical protein
MGSWRGRVRWARGWLVLAALPVLAALAACGGGGGGGGDAPSPPSGGGPGLAQANYWPMQPGDRWTYLDPVSGERTVTHVAGVQVVNGRSGMRLRSVAYSLPQYLHAEASASESVFFADAAGLAEAPWAGNDPLSAAIGTVELARLPLRQGDRFQQIDRAFDNLFDFDGDGRADRLRIRSTVTVVGTASISVPAGMFADCLHLRTEVLQTVTLSRDDRRVEVTAVANDWRAPGVGSVRLDVTTSSGGITESAARELEHYGVGTRRSDDVAPTVLYTAPVHASTSGQPSYVTVQFSEDVDPELALQGVSLHDAAGHLLPSLQPDARLRTGRIELTPVTPLASGIYELRVARSVADSAGNALAADLVSRFTVDATPPSLVSISPPSGAVEVPVDTAITITFSEPVVSVLHDSIELIRRSDGEVFGGLRIEMSGSTVTLRLPHGAQLRRDTEYRVRVRAGLPDALSNRMPADLESTFRTTAGRFSPPVTLVDAIATRSTAVGDVNGDGRDDLVIDMTVAGAGHGVFVRYQRPDGTLGPLVDTGWRRAGLHCHGGAPLIGDLNGDGRLDVALLDGDCGVQVLRQSADGQRLDALPRLAGTGSIRLLDFNGDGRLDLVGMRLEDATALQLWLQDASGNLVAQADVVTGSVDRLGASFELADLDGDGRADLITVERVGFGFLDQRLRVYRQSAGGALARVEERALTVDQLVLGDMDADGRVDLLLLNGGALNVIRQLAGGALSALESVLPDSVAHPRLADVDGDGRTDLLFMQSGGWRMTLQLRRADGGWGPPDQYFDYALDARPWTVGDLNGDGRPDLVIGVVALMQLPPTAGASLASRSPTTARTPVGAAAQRLRSVTGQSGAR